MIGNNEQAGGDSYKKETWDLEQDLLERIMTAVKNLKFGTVTVVVQDGRVVQINKTEKLRLR